MFNMGHWFQCYAFGIIEKTTFPKSLGFLEKGEDISNIISNLDFQLAWASIIGVWTFPNRPLTLAMPSLPPQPKGVNFLEEYSDSLLDARKHELLSTSGPRDLVQKLSELQKRDSGKIMDSDIKQTATGNVAGNDTKSIALSGFLYHLCKGPAVLRKFREEINGKNEEGKFFDPITFKETQELPYLQAGIREGLRMHPAVWFTMPRVVPKGGKTMIGWYFPKGMIAGINPWVAHRNRQLFDKDAYLFRPKRWLESKEASSQREVYFLTFGLGSCACIGKNTRLLEISKAIPQVVRHFDFELQNKGEWKCTNHWVAKPGNFVCRVKRRELRGELSQASARSECVGRSLSSREQEYLVK